MKRVGEDIVLGCREVLEMRYELIELMWESRDKELIWEKKKGRKGDNKVVGIRDG